MSDISIVDGTWLAAPAATVAPHLADPGNWTRWWPGLELVPTELRGPKGVRWQVAAARVPGRRPMRPLALAGSAEVWLEPLLDGSVAHFFLRLNGNRPLRPRRRARVADHYRALTKRAFWGLGDRLDPGRRVRMSNAGHG